MAINASNVGTIKNDGNIFEYLGMEYGVWGLPRLLTVPGAHSRVRGKFLRRSPKKAVNLVVHSLLSSAIHLAYLGTSL
jgi:hypothetical protein